MAFVEATLAIIASLIAVNVAFIAISAVVARSMGLRIAEANIHAGPQLARFDFGQTKIFVRLFPIGSGLTLLERPVEPAAADAKSIVYLDELTPLCRMLFALSAPCGFMLYAAIVLRASAGQHFATALPQIYLGALKPMSLGPELLERYVGVWQSAPITALAILSAKYGVYLLVPTAGSPGLTALLTLLRSAFGYEPPSSFNLLQALLLFGPPLLVIGGWAVAIAVYLYLLLDATI